MVTVYLWSRKVLLSVFEFLTMLVGFECWVLTGHGQALLNFLYDLARSRESVFEITVEDPAPGFEKVKTWFRH